MSNQIFSSGGFVPRGICPSLAIKLQPAFVMAIEALYNLVHSTVKRVCIDMVIYEKTWNQSEVSSLLYHFLSRAFLRRPELSFWLALKGDARKFQIVPEPQFFSNLTGQGWDLNADFVPPASYVQPVPKGIVHLGHAGVFINEEARCLIDPVFYEPQNGQAIEALNMAALGDVDAVFFTHHHADHFDIGTLAQLPRHMRVFIPHCLGRPFEPDMKHLLNKLGFHNVTEVRSGDRVPLSGRSHVDILPFFGEASEIAPFGAYCPLYSSAQRRILFNADSGPNHKGESLLESPELTKILRDGPVDTVFGTWCQARSFLFQVSPTILFSENFTSADWLTVTENCDCSPEYVLALAKGVGAQKLITYAERAADIFNENALQSGDLPLISFFWKEREEYVKILKRANIETLEAIPRACF